MRIGDSLFTPYGMQLRIDEPDFELVGSVRYDHLLPLRSDIMGPFAYVPMETKHTVFSMRHQVTGSIRLNGDALDIRNGIGYMEGDCGHTFPRSYFWMQCLDVRQDASVMLAIAEIPLGPIRFTGCIGIVALGETEYRFATYRGVRIVEHTPTMAEVRQGDMSLRVEVLDDRGHKLQAPAQGLMDRTIHESPSVPARIRFVKAANLFWTRWSPKQATNSFPPLRRRTGRPLCVPRGADPRRVRPHDAGILGVSSNLRERGCTMLYDNIMIPYDGSASSKAALAEAVRFAKDDPGLTLRIVQIIDTDQLAIDKLEAEGATNRPSPRRRAPENLRGGHRGSQQGAARENRPRC